MTLLLQIVWGISVLGIVQEGFREDRARLILVACCLFLLPIVLWELPDDRTYIVTEEGDVKQLPWHGVPATWGNVHDVPSGHLGVDSQLSLVTENPKVRTISYHVQASIVEPVMWVRFVHRTEPDVFFVGNRLEGCTYEFNEHHSRDLARFYNPKDPQQQEEFRAFTGKWFNDNCFPMDAGLEVRASNFRLE